MKLNICEFKGNFLGSSDGAGINLDASISNYQAAVELAEKKETTNMTTDAATTTTLSIFEDNAGGLSILRHADNAVFIGLECIYAAGRPEDGTLLSEDETEYWLSLDADTETAIRCDEWHYRHSDGHEFRFEEDGVDASCFEGTPVIAERAGGKWITYGNMGENGSIATGVA